MNNVKSAGLWDVIKKGREEQKCLNSWKPKKFDSYPDLEVNYLDKDWLGNVISTEKLRTMKPENPMLIAAQTGSGKSTLLLSKLLKIALAENKRILYLCSRSALAMKTKQDAIRDEINAEVFCGKRRVKELAELFTPQGLKERVNFGGIDVVLYQNFIKTPEEFNPKDYAFVFMDEIHFITSDSTFIPHTYDALNTLISKFANVRRIYVTATPDECMELIWSEETYKNDKLLCGPRTILEVFTMKEDYSFLNPRFFNTLDELITLIKASNELWLVFVDDKKVGEFLQESLTISGVFLPLFFTSESDKEAAEFQKMIKQEQLPYKVVITTKVLDVGVNIRDKNLSVAILCNQPVEVKQQLGRKRVEGDERVNAYFKVPSSKELAVRRRSLMKRISDIKQALFALKAGEYIDQISPPFGIKGTRVIYNPICIEKLKNELKNVENLTEKMNGIDDPDERSIAYAKILLQNFDGIKYEEDDLLIESHKSRLEKIIASHIDTTMDKEKFAGFSMAIKDILGDTRAHKRESPQGIKSINDSIKPYGYVINSSGSPVQYTIEKLGE